LARGTARAESSLVAGRLETIVHLSVIHWRNDVGVRTSVRARSDQLTQVAGRHGPEAEIPLVEGPWGRAGPIGRERLAKSTNRRSPEIDLDELLRALRAVAAGGSVIDPKVVEGLLARRQQPAASLLETLIPREMEVLGEMAQGKSNAAISETLFISPSGVEKHINSIFAKLMLSPEDGTQHRRVAAVLTFLRNQDLRDPPDSGD
jgi:DNA-binding CsgD family transcriptional regulator